MQLIFIFYHAPFHLSYVMLNIGGLVLTGKGNGSPGRTRISRGILYDWLWLSSVSQFHHMSQATGMVCNLWSVVFGYGQLVGGELH